MGMRRSMGSSWGPVSIFVDKKLKRDRSKSPKKSTTGDSIAAGTGTGTAGRLDPSELYMNVSGPTPPPKDYEENRSSVQMESTQEQSTRALDTYEPPMTQNLAAPRWAFDKNQSESYTQSQTSRNIADQPSLQQQDHHYGASHSLSHINGNPRSESEPLYHEEQPDYDEDENELEATVRFNPLTRTSSIQVEGSPGSQLWSNAAAGDDSFHAPFASGDKPDHYPGFQHEQSDCDESFYEEDEPVIITHEKHPGSTDESLVDPQYLGDRYGPLEARPSIANFAETAQRQSPKPDPPKAPEVHGSTQSATSNSVSSLKNRRRSLKPAPLRIGHKRSGSCPAVQNSSQTRPAPGYHGLATPQQSSDSHATSPAVQQHPSDRTNFNQARTTHSIGLGQANVRLAEKIQNLTAQGYATVRPLIHVPEEENHVKSDASEARDLDTLEYPPDELRALSFDALRKATFDPTPFQNPISPSTAAIPLDSLSTQLAAKIHSSPDEQSELLASLTLKQWDEAGDWFIQKFTDEMKKMVELRKEKRKREEEIELEVAQRNDSVARKKKQIEEAIDRMKTDGVKVLRKGQAK